MLLTLLRLPLTLATTGPLAVVRAVQATAALLPLLPPLIEELTRSAARISALLDVIEPVPARVGAVVGSAEQLVGRVGGAVDIADGLVTRIGATVGTADGLVTQVGTTVSDAGRLVGDVRATVGSVDNLLTGIGLTVGEAQALVGQVQVVQQTINRLVADLGPVLEVLAGLDPRLVAGLDTLLEDAGRLLAGARELPVELVEHATVSLTALPALLDRVDAQVLPAIGSLEGLVPVVDRLSVHVDSLNDVVADVGALLAGIPGAGRLLRRGEKGARPSVETARR